MDLGKPPKVPQTTHNWQEADKTETSKPSYFPPTKPPQSENPFGSPTPNYNDPAEIGDRSPQPFRSLAYGSGEPGARALASTRVLTYKVKRLESTTVVKFRKGLPVPSANRPVNNSGAMVPFVSGLSLSKTTPTINGRGYAQIQIIYLRPPDKRVYQSAKIYIKGYRANPNWIQYGETFQSPAIILLEQTGETVSIALASRSPAGDQNDPDKSPTAGVAL